MLEVMGCFCFASALLIVLAVSRIIKPWVEPQTPPVYDRDPEPHNPYRQHVPVLGDNAEHEDSHRFEAVQRWMDRREQ